MNHFATKDEYENQISICFDAGNEEIMVIGAKMEVINEQAYMNGYNWEAFLNYYLRANYPELLEELSTDSEGGTYVALYEKSNAVKAENLTDIINALLTNPENIYHFLQENGEEIEWD